MKITFNVSKFNLGVFALFLFLIFGAAFVFAQVSHQSAEVYLPGGVSLSTAVGSGFVSTTKICTTSNGLCAPQGGSTEPNPWFTGTGGDLYYNGGDVGIGISNPTSELHVNGAAAVNSLTSVGAGTFGTVGIGISSPQEELHIRTSGGNTPAVLFDFAGELFSISKAGATVNFNTVQDDDTYSFNYNNNPAFTIHRTGGIFSEGPITTAGGVVIDNNLDLGNGRLHISDNANEGCYATRLSEADGTALATCNTQDEIAMGGGGSCSTGNLLNSRPNPAPASDGAQTLPTGWFAQCDSGTVQTYVVCCNFR